jgi:putative salt-induced outer membrane protein YdiY
MLVTLLAAALAQDPTYDRTKEAADEVEKPVTSLSAELGGAFSSGNAFALAFNGGVNGKHVWQANQFTFGAGVFLNLAKIDSNGDGTLDDAERESKLTFTSQRVFGAARYDRFFGKMNSLYISGGGERDPFAGLLWRFNQQFGYRRVIVASEKTDLDVEIGLAYTEENFSEGVDADGNPINAEILDAHYLGARAYISFEHRFNESVAIGDNVEMIENLFTPADFRLVNNAYLTAKLGGKFSIKLSHRLAFDNLPVEGFRPLDQTTQITLVASIF